MKKSRIIALALVVSLVLMGASYAAWTDRVIISNAVSTGELKVEFVESCMHPWVAVFDNVMSSPPYLDASIQHGAKTTTVTINNMYPGSTALYEAMIKNLGTIPAKIDNVDVIFSGNTSQELKNKLIVWGLIMHWRLDTSGHPYVVETKPIMGVQLNNLETRLNSLLQNMELKVGDFITFDTDDEFKQVLADNLEGYNPEIHNCLFFHLPTSAGNETEAQSAQFDITFNFKQFNF